MFKIIFPSIRYAAFLIEIYSKNQSKIRLYRHIFYTNYDIDFTY